MSGGSLSQYKNKLCSAEEAVKKVNSGDGIFLHSNAAAPHSLISAMVARKHELKDVDIYKIITLGPAPYAEADCRGSFYVHSMFVGPNIREAVNEGRADYTPIFFSELPALFESGTIKIDGCLLSVSPPDDEGYLSLGVSVDSTWGALKNSRYVLAEVNKQMPRTSGRTKIHVSQIDALVESDRALPNLHNEVPSNEALMIADFVASLVDDGATLQMGIGMIPNAVLEALQGKKHLGVHTEMFSDAAVKLAKLGVIDNSRKTLLPGKTAVSFVMGSQELYDFVDGNELIEFHGSDWINDPFVIAQNEKVTAINSALQIDLSGQVCADSLGTSMYSGCGGQVDFIRGAKRSKQGKAIIALESTARDGTISRIVPYLSKGSGVVTTRADLQYVVTEYGIASLQGKNLKDRVKGLIEIAHPRFRAELEQESWQFKYMGKGVSCL